MTTRRGDELVPGDVFEWCGRRVTLRRIERQPLKYGRRRPSRWLHVVEDDGTEHRLSYWDDESVRPWIETALADG